MHKNDLFEEIMGNSVLIIPLSLFLGWIDVISYSSSIKIVGWYLIIFSLLSIIRGKIRFMGPWFNNTHYESATNPIAFWFTFTVYLLIGIFLLNFRK
jgi:hypothetical protein